MANAMPWAERLDSPPLAIRPRPEEWRGVRAEGRLPLVAEVSLDPAFRANQPTGTAASAAGAAMTDG